jgi:hypothetical protein
MLEDIARIDAALREYAQAALDRGASKIAQGRNVSHIGKAKRLRQLDRAGAEHRLGGLT